MTWEFEQAWPGGLLLSGDIITNRAFDDFARQVGQPPHKLGALGGMG